MFNQSKFASVFLSMVIWPTILSTYCSVCVNSIKFCPLSLALAGVLRSASHIHCLGFPNSLYCADTGRKTLPNKSISHLRYHTTGPMPVWAPQDSHWIIWSISLINPMVILMLMLLLKVMRMILLLVLIPMSVPAYCCCSCYCCCCCCWWWW